MFFPGKRTPLKFHLKSRHCQGQIPRQIRIIFTNFSGEQAEYLLQASYSFPVSRLIVDSMLLVFAISQEDLKSIMTQEGAYLLISAHGPPIMHVGRLPILHPKFGSFLRLVSSQGRKKVPQRTCATKILPNFRANFLARLASKPHPAAKEGRQKGIGKKVTKNVKNSDKMVGKR